jgi:hypothetical protein
MLTDRDYATEEEKVAIKNLADSWRLCGEKLVAVIGESLSVHEEVPLSMSEAT